MPSYVLPGLLLAVAAALAGLTFAPAAHADEQPSARCQSINQPILDFDDLSNGHVLPDGGFEEGDRLTVSAGPPTDGGTPTLIAIGVANTNPASGMTEDYKIVATATYPGTAQYVFHGDEPGVAWWFPNDPLTVDATWNIVCDLAPDTSPPAVVVAPGPNDAAAATGWYNAASSGTDGVEVQVSATDRSGVAHIVCRDGTAPAPVLDTTSATGSFTLGDGEHSIRCVATDGVGNTNASTVVPVAFDVDQTAPVVSATVSPTQLLLSGTGTVSATAFDPAPGSGMDAAGVSCGSLDTSSVGTRTVSCSANDVAGHTGTGQATYTVGYAFLGFGSPIPMSNWQAGRSIPVRFQLGDATNAAIPDLAALAIASDCGARALLAGPAPSSATAAGPVCLGYESGADRFQGNLKTPATLSPGEYDVTVQIVVAGSVVTEASEPVLIKG